MTAAIPAVKRKMPSPWERMLLRLFPEKWSSVSRLLALVIVAFLAFVSLFPLYWGLTTSFKRPIDVAVIPPSFIVTQPSIENYDNLIRGVGYANAPVMRWFLNSFIVTMACTAAGLVVTSMAGYAFARKQFWWRDRIFWMLIFTMLVPGWASIIASYAWVGNLGMFDTYWALILPSMASPFAVFLFRQFASTLPDELFQAAKIDGASEWALYWRIAIPLCRPSLATLGIFGLIGHWNDFLWPLLVLNKKDMYTLPVGVSMIMYQLQARGPGYGTSTAAAMLMSFVPIIFFLIAQRQMIKGLTLGALKG